MIIDLQKYENYCIFSERKARKDFYTLLKIFVESQRRKLIKEIILENCANFN